VNEPRIIKSSDLKGEAKAPHFLLRVFVPVGIAAIIIATTATISHFPWLLLIPVALILIAIPVYKIRRSMWLRKRGYFITASRESPVVYEEMRDGAVSRIPIHTVDCGPGDYYVAVPTREEWSRIAPDWAQERRDEIFKRILKSRRKGSVALPDDWEE
jgi:hypothetical protein